ncbi:hypothetical protein DL98DRAFT_575925 [Cadophora sp. DSE1049]|nr:hypothetical protein DL98DRAFT_575925 [Cadophora sp. DSE1049]
MLLTIHHSPFCADDDTTFQISTVITHMLLQPFKEPSVETAAQEINQLSVQWSQQTLDDSTDTRKGSAFVWFVWTEICFIARQIPYCFPAQETLVRFIAAMRDVPDDVDGKWRELNYFGWAARDALNDIKEGSQEEINFYSFTAKLTRDSTQDFSLWAIWCFRDIIEDEPSATAPAWWRAQAAQKAAPELDARLPVAALWIDILGEKIYSKRLLSRQCCERTWDLEE